MRETMEGNYEKFMKQMEIIYLYRNIYHLNDSQIAYILDSHSIIIQCYRLHLLENNHVKNHLKENIQDV